MDVVEEVVAKVGSVERVDGGEGEKGLVSPGEIGLKRRYARLPWKWSAILQKKPHDLIG